MTRYVLQARLREALDSDDKKTVMEASNLTRSNVFDVEMEFYMSTPQSANTGQKNALLWCGDVTKKPDLDNLAKFYLDAGNGILWSDDKQITSLSSKKHYSDNPKTVIKILGRKETTLSDEVRGILSIFSPAEFHNLALDLRRIYEEMVDIGSREVAEGFYLYPGCSREDDTARAAILLSRLAEKYGDQLKKIKTKFPNFWEDQMRNEEQCKTVLQTKIERQVESMFDQFFEACDVLNSYEDTNETNPS